MCVHNPGSTGEYIWNIKFTSYLGGLVNASADTMPGIKRRVRLAWASCKRFKRELYDVEAAPFTLKVRMLTAEMLETLLYGCVTWILGKEHFAELRTAHHRFSYRSLVSYAKAFETAQCESVETTIRKRCLLFAGGVQRTNNERLTRRMMFWTIAGGENPGPGRPEKKWAHIMVENFGVFRATEGSTKKIPLLFGVEAML